MTRSALTSLLRGPAILGLVLCVAMPLAQARPVAVYMVDVAGETPQALQDAMRQVLVRSTGHREAASQPALAALISSAGSYVKSYGKGQVSFDGPGIERAIRAAGLEVWSADRPVTLVTFSPVPAHAGEDSVRGELEKQAARRGLPVTVVVAASTDTAGKELTGDALIQNAKRYGAEQVLVGRQDGSQWRWTLYNPRPHAFSGTLAAGIDGTADLLAPPSGDAVAGGGTAGPAGGGSAIPTAGAAPAPAAASAAAANAAAGGPETLTRIQVQGISDLEDYAAVERMLEAVPGVRRARMAEAQGTQAIFEVAVRGGADALDRGLAGQARLARASATGSSLVYLYRP